MSYAQFETSKEIGQPVALYEFRYGNTRWRYCTDSIDRIVGLDENNQPATWISRAISDEGITQGGGDQNDLQIVAPSDLPIALLFRNRQPSGKVWLSVRRWHVGDPHNETPLQWSGTVVNATGVDVATVNLACRSLGGTYDRNGLRLAWDRMCPHPLYGPGCFVDKALHQYPRNVASLDGTSFTCTTHSEPVEGTFTGGFLEWQNPDGSYERRGIERQVGNHFEVLGLTDGMLIGMSILLYPGCPRNTTGCKAFSNLPNYGGFPHLPGKSPFDGSPVF